MTGGFVNMCSLQQHFCQAALSARDDAADSASASSMPAPETSGQCYFAHCTLPLLKHPLAGSLRNLEAGFWCTVLSSTCA